MRPFSHTIPLGEARAILDAAARPLTRVERVELAGLSLRVLAEDVTAGADVPPFARAMMDGYAVRAADTDGASRATPRHLALAGRVFTGEVFAGSVAAGTCVEIATGAPLPAGADAVVMVEDTQPGDTGQIAVAAAVVAGQHVGRAGADIARGATVLRAGDWLLPGRVGVLAAVGRTAAAVVARPRVAIVSTGNEVVAPGQRLGPGQIYDINRHTLAALIARHGGEPVPLDVAGDTLEALDQAVDDAGRCDVIVFSGGSSVGDRDLVLDVLRRRGTIAFHGIATRPGKPTAFGQVNGVPVFGMPGNPTSCLTNAYVLLAPFLRRVAGLPPERPHIVRAPLTRRIASAAGRHQFYTVRLAEGGVEPAFKASGDITSMAHADGYLEIAADVTAVEAGTMVDVVLF
jgi:molybdenum cofactor synthesis domain-containing protein